MNKAFTANINDQVTARGYLDENDQLIMLEPEGSGGGGDIETATVVIKSTVNKPITAKYVNTYEQTLIAAEEEIPAYIEAENTVTITAVKGSGVSLVAELGAISNLTVESGSAEILSTTAFKVLGDCEIEVS